MYKFGQRKVPQVLEISQVDHRTKFEIKTLKQKSRECVDSRNLLRRNAKGSYLGRRKKISDGMVAKQEKMKILEDKYVEI